MPIAGRDGNNQILGGPFASRRAPQTQWRGSVRASAAAKLTGFGSRPPNRTRLGSRCRAKALPQDRVPATSRKARKAQTKQCLSSSGFGCCPGFARERPFSRPKRAAKAKRLWLNFAEISVSATQQRWCPFESEDGNQKSCWTISIIPVSNDDRLYCENAW